MLQPQLSASMRTLTQAPLPAQPLRPATTQPTFAASLESHPHRQIRSPLLESAVAGKPTTYTKLPPLDKLMAKLGPHATTPSLLSLRTFVEARAASHPQDTPLPDLPTLLTLYQTTLLASPPDTLFPAIDLLRLGALDPRLSGSLAEEPRHATLATILLHVGALDPLPSSLALVTLQLASNLASTPLLADAFRSDPPLAALFAGLATASLLEEAHAPTRAAAAGLAVNLAAVNARVRRGTGEEGLEEGVQVELVASLVEMLSGGVEKDEGVRKMAVTALGLLVWFADVEGDVREVCQVLDAKKAVGDSEVGREVKALLAVGAKEVAKDEDAREELDAFNDWRLRAQ